MIIVMRPGADEAQIDRVVERVRSDGFDVHLSQGVERTIVGVKGVSHDALTEPYEALDGVEEVLRVLKPYKLASKEFHPLPTEIRVGGVVFGGEQVLVGAGPCSVEGPEMYREIGAAVRDAGATFLRGGAFKPRSSPYSFQGLGEEGLRIMREVGDELGLPVQTEATNPRALELVARYADIVQIGARNMQNYDLLKEAGQAGKPVVLKRGMAATIKDLLLSAEYVMSEGNEEVILCERGIRTFETATRNTLDVSAVPVIKELSHLPVMIDPSHASGHKRYVLSLALAGAAAGADALVVEVHNHPDVARSDGEQSLLPAEFADLVARVRAVAEAIGRHL
jgi:3-deoxy-7-phosphoheptulonate synthase